VLDNQEIEEIAKAIRKKCKLNRINVVIIGIIVAVNKIFKWSLKKLAISLIVGLGLISLLNHSPSYDLKIKKYKVALSILENLECIKNTLNIEGSYERKDWEQVDDHWRKIETLLEKTNNLTFLDRFSKSDSLERNDLFLLNLHFYLTIQSNLDSYQGDLTKKI
jgi:hypothetical protein